MTAATVESWLEKLGYAAEPGVLHQRGDAVPDTHPYALEIKTLLKPEGAIRAQAVFDVEGVPTVVFVGEHGRSLSQAELDKARQRIWNQNLATIVIELKGEEAIALPARKLKERASACGSTTRVRMARFPRRMSRLPTCRDGCRNGSTSRRGSIASCWRTCRPLSHD